jgi:hypothetical protein
MISTDLQCDLTKCDNNSNRAMVDNEEDDRPNARTKDIKSEDDIVLLQSGGKKHDLPTTPPAELHG